MAASKRTFRDNAFRTSRRRYAARPRFSAHAGGPMLRRMNPGRASMIATIVSPRLMRIGGGSVGQIAEVLGMFGLSRPLVVTDRWMLSSGTVTRCLDPLRAAGLAPQVFAETVPDPTDTVIEAGAA